MSYIEKQQNIPQITGLVRVSTDYEFNSSTGLVCVKDYGFESVVSIFNMDRNIMMYQVGSEELSGTAYQSEVSLDLDTSSMDSGDRLYILYQRSDESSTKTLLCKLIKLQKETNKLLNKIYN